MTLSTKVSTGGRLFCLGIAFQTFEWLLTKDFMEKRKRTLTSALLTTAILSTLAASAQATFLPTPSYAETGDAGQTLATAQNAGAFPGGASTITGTIGSGTDADLYFFTLSAATSLQFTVTSTSLTFGGSLDGALFLFDSTGHALFANDDSSGANINPSLTALNLAAGTYYLGISLSGNEPVNSNNQLLFAGGLSTSTRGAATGVNPTTEATFNGNVGVAETGTYSIGLSAVPEPSTNAALAVGALASLVLVRRFRRQQAA